MSRKNWEIYFDAIKKQDWREARNVLNEIAKDEKVNPQVYLKMGDVCQRSGDTSSAVKAYHISARIQCLQGFNQKAMALYKIILRIEPNNHEAILKTEQILRELEGSRGQHFKSLPMPEKLPETLVEISEIPVEKPVPSLSLPPVSATISPAGPDWLESTAHAPAEEIREISEAARPEAEDLFERSVRLQTSPHGLSDKDAEEGGISDFTMTEEPETSGGTYDPGAALTGGEGIPSMEEIFSELPEADFQKLLDGLVIPLSERQAAESAVPQLFSGMSGEEFRRVLAELDKKVYPGNTPVIEDGDSGDSMFIIKSGQARVVAHMMGREIELAMLGEGDLFGEVAFLTGRTRTASVIAYGTLEVYEISRFEIERIIEINPEILSRLEGFYESRIRDTIQKIRPKQPGTGML